MLQNAYFLAKIGADTAENEHHLAENCQKLATAIPVVRSSTGCNLSVKSQAVPPCGEQVPQHLFEFRREESLPTWSPTSSAVENVTDHVLCGFLVFSLSFIAMHAVQQSPAKRINCLAVLVRP